MRLAPRGDDVLERVAIALNLAPLPGALAMYAMPAARVVGVAQKIGVARAPPRRARDGRPRRRAARAAAAGHKAAVRKPRRAGDPGAERADLRGLLDVAQVDRPCLRLLCRHLARAHRELLGVDVQRPRADSPRRRQLSRSIASRPRTRSTGGCTSPAGQRWPECVPRRKSPRRSATRATVSSCSTSQARTAGSRPSCASATSRCRRRSSTFPAARALGTR